MSINPSWPFSFIGGSDGRLDRDVGNIGGAMAIVQRLIVVLLLLCSSIYAFADDIPARKRYSMVTVDGNFFDGQEMCSLFQVGTGRVWIFNEAIPACQWNGDNQPVNQTWYCPSGSSRLTVGGVEICRFPTSCPAPQVRNQTTGACEDPPAVCQAGRILLTGPFSDTDGDGSIPSSSCISGCRATLTGGGAPQINCSIGGAGSVGICGYVYPGNYVDTGSNCSDGETAPPKEPPANKPPCPACDCMESGGSFGQVQGVDVCLPKGTPGTLPVQTTPPPKVTETKPPATPENPDPDPVKTIEPQPTVTVIPNPGGGEPTVKEETTNPDGSTTTVTSGMGEYCKNNATGATCKSTGTGNGGSGGGDFKGSCATGFTCSGDGVNCAIARAAYQHRCDDVNELKEFEPAAEEGRRILMGEEDPEIKSWLNKEGDHKRTINLADEVKESGEYQFAAQCISDVQFSIGGHSVTVPFSKLCPYFEMIGYILLAAAYLYALRIVGIW
ncbi:hypothetical protein LG200_06135 [Methylobacillus caricis]|uniref:virulence factor TspB C-terminal domain-related protein n=1 Tax=Methylobacillus caricis TaxID=1971611 RepID=UPI001CFFFE40|nr:virulence factor TspB C-terminal domain-related protein [Methylobacillus caricis]MCB5187585.1 hypothetical protein [Methylobacillus caricis]